MFVHKASDMSSKSYSFSFYIKLLLHTCYEEETRRQVINGSGLGHWRQEGYQPVHDAEVGVGRGGGGGLLLVAAVADSMYQRNCGVSRAAEAATASAAAGAKRSGTSGARYCCCQVVVRDLPRNEAGARRFLKKKCVSRSTGRAKSFAERAVAPAVWGNVKLVHTAGQNPGRTLHTLAFPSRGQPVWPWLGAGGRNAGNLA